VKTKTRALIDVRGSTLVMILTTVYPGDSPSLPVLLD
jgi:hypothetical protein